jgi:hypothetical protein
VTAVGPILVTRVGEASGSRAIAAALACAVAEPGRAGLLIDLAAGRSPRPGLVSSAAARALEERLAAHLPGARVASRGGLCHLALPADDGGVEAIAGAAAIGREAGVAIHLPPGFLQVVLGRGMVRVGAALLRADLPADRALTALAVGALREESLRVAVAKRPLGWLAARRALLGAPPGGDAGLPERLLEKLLGAAASPYYSPAGLPETPDDRSPRALYVGL